MGWPLVRDSHVYKTKMIPLVVRQRPLSHHIRLLPIRQFIMATTEKEEQPRIEQQLETSDVPAVDNKAIIQGAAENVAFEHSMTVRQAIKYYKWAIFWCLAVR